MLDTDQQSTDFGVALVSDPGRPTWKEGWWNWILLGGGLLLVITSGMETGRITGAAGGFMLGVAILALVIAVPLSRRLRTLFRLVKLADERGAYEEAGDGETSDASSR